MAIACVQQQVEEALSAAQPATMRLDGFCRRNAGYLVVLGTMWITTSNFAFLRSASVLYTAFLEQYRCSYAEATWTFTLVGGVGSLTTLLAGFLVHYTSVRLVCSVGIVICSVSIWLSSLATSIRQIILLGAVQGGSKRSFPPLTTDRSH